MGFSLRVGGGGLVIICSNMMFSSEYELEKGCKHTKNIMDTFEIRMIPLTQKLLADKVPAGLRWLSDLAESAEAESVRLGAVKDLLDRAGLKPVEKIETTTIESMSKEDIERELNALLKH